MENLPGLFSDLALILVTAGIITVIFRWLKQPLVLGYIVAGFLIGPYFTYFPVVKDTTSVEVWSEIGMVFLLFALGLEFSFKKLKKVGGTGIITAFTELIIMFLAGFTLGHILGWNQMSCIFLGCMLSISSTTIIVKAFDDLQLKRQRFTGTVIGVLVVEDLIAVLLMVILSTLSVSKQFDGRELGYNLVKLAFFLIIWFIFGIYIIPTLLRKMRKMMTEETLTIVAIGLCFMMVVFANYAGFSSALGAFIMGSILAETLEAEAIHKVVSPIKDLFGAVFFVSVGMMVDPQILVKYALPIIVIAITVVLIKSLSATIGMLISGQDIKTAIRSGFCFCQIGEFSFIIAGLGVSFGVTNEFLYPIIVSVSIITTFVTPYMMKLSTPAYQFIYSKLPDKWKNTISQYSSTQSESEGLGVKKFIVVQMKNLVIYGAIITALTLLSTTILKPFITTRIPNVWGSILGAAITLAVLAPFLWAIAFKHHFKRDINDLLSDKNVSHAMVFATLLLRYLIALMTIGIVIAQYIKLSYGLVIVISVFVIIVIAFSRQVMRFYQRIESNFMKNLNQRQRQNSFIVPENLQNNIHLEKMTVSPDCEYVGKRLIDTDLRPKYGASLVSVERGSKIYDLPSKDFMIFPYDKLTIVANDNSTMELKSVIEVNNGFAIKERKQSDIDLYNFKITENSMFFGKSLRSSGFNELYNATVIAIERNDEFMLNPLASTVFAEGDKVWFVSASQAADAIINNKRMPANNTVRH